MVLPVGSRLFPSPVSPRLWLSVGLGGGHLPSQPRRVVYSYARLIAQVDRYLPRIPKVTRLVVVTTSASPSIATGRGGVWASGLNGSFVGFTSTISPRGHRLSFPHHGRGMGLVGGAPPILCAWYGHHPYWE
jgi:hypothetical protein